MVAGRTTVTDEYGRTRTLNANGDTIAVTTTTQGRAIARCTTCKRTGSIHYDITTTRTDNNPGGDSSTYHHPTGTLGGLRRPGDLDRFLHAVAKSSATCNHTLTVKPVKGFEDPNKPCNGKCRGAVGPSCSCSCGGKQHGAAHGAW